MQKYNKNEACWYCDKNVIFFEKFEYVKNYDKPKILNQQNFVSHGLQNLEKKPEKFYIIQTIIDFTISKTASHHLSF